MRRRRKCPRHDVRLTKSDEVAEKIITDLIFTKNGCRKTLREIRRRERLLQDLRLPLPPPGYIQDLQELPGVWVPGVGDATSGLRYASLMTPSRK